MENFEKCTAAMLGGPCSQHVTGNTSRQNQPCYNDGSSPVRLQAIIPRSIERLPSTTLYSLNHRHLVSTIYGLYLLKGNFRQIFKREISRRGPDAWKHFRHLTEISCIAKCFKVLANTNLILPKNDDLKSAAHTVNLYASGYRRRGHYVFGLSVCPSKARNNIFLPLHGFVGPSDQHWPFL